jgi:1-acyl-sn-glycerol-3-phosphate acyltransferase
MSSGSSLGPRPSPLPLSESLVSCGIRVPLFFLGTCFFGSLALVASLFDRRGRLQHRIARMWARFSLAVSGARLTVLGSARLTGQTAVYACNHQSYMDTPVIFSALPFQFRIVARHDLWTMPFIGWYLNRSGQVPVEVEPGRASVASLLSAVRTLRSGMSLFIFPEGGRTEDGHLAKFLHGPAFLAIRAQLPIVPMALAGTWELLPMHSSAFHPVPVTLAVGEPIETRGMTMKQVDQLTGLLHERIAALYYEHSWLSGPQFAGDRGGSTDLDPTRRSSNAQPGNSLSGELAVRNGNSGIARDLAIGHSEDVERR